MQASTCAQLRGVMNTLERSPRTPERTVQSQSGSIWWCRSTIDLVVNRSLVARRAVEVIVSVQLPYQYATCLAALDRRPSRKKSSQKSASLVQNTLSLRLSVADLFDLQSSHNGEITRGRLAARIRKSRTYSQKEKRRRIVGAIAL